MGIVKGNFYQNLYTILGSRLSIPSGYPILVANHNANATVQDTSLGPVFKLAGAMENVKTSYIFHNMKYSRFKRAMSCFLEYRGKILPFVDFKSGMVFFTAMCIAVFVCFVSVFISLLWL